MPVGDIQKCYGRKKHTVQEKSFIRNFFDENNSSSSSFFNNSLEKNCQEDKNVNNKENVDIITLNSPSSFDFEDSEESVKDDNNKENIDVITFKSPPLFELSSEDSDNNGKNNNVVKSPSLFRLSCEDSIEGNSSQQMKISNTGKSMKAKQVNKRKQPVKRKKYGKKNVKGLQHLSTKFCKSQQPCWSEFENFKFTVEKLNDQNYRRKNFIVEEITSDNSDADVPVIKQKINVPENDIKNKKMKQFNIFSENTNSLSVNNFLSLTDYNSSGELFLPTPVKKKSLKKGKSLQKKITDNKKAEREKTKLDTNCNPHSESMEIISNFQDPCKVIEIQKPRLKFNSSSDSMSLSEQKEISCHNAETLFEVSSDLPCQEKKTLTVNTKSYPNNSKKINSGVGNLNDYNCSDDSFNLFLTSLHYSSKKDEKNDQNRDIDFSDLENNKNISYFQNALKQLKIQKPFFKSLSNSSDSTSLLEKEKKSCLNAEMSSAVIKYLPCQESKAITTVNTRSFSNNLRNFNSDIRISNNCQNLSDENFNIFLTSLHHCSKLDEKNGQCSNIDSSGLGHTENISNIENSVEQINNEKSLLNLSALSEPKEIPYLNAENSTVVSSNVVQEEKIGVNKRCFSKNLKNLHSKIEIFDNEHNNMGEDFKISPQHSKRARSNHCHSNDFLEENYVELQCDMEMEGKSYNDNEQHDSRNFSKNWLHHKKGESSKKVFQADDKNNSNQSKEMFPRIENLSFAENGLSVFISAHEKVSVSHEECNQNSNKNSSSPRKRKLSKSKLDMLYEMVDHKAEAQEKNSFYDEGNVSGNSNFGSFIQNISNFSKNLTSNFLKKQGQFVTSTPIVKNKKPNPTHDDLFNLIGNESIIDDYARLSNIEKKENCSKKYASVQSILMTNSHAVIKSFMTLKSQRSLDVSKNESLNPRTLRKSRSSINLTASKNVSNFLEPSNDITKTKLLELCNQDSVIAFADIYDWKKLKIKKIGEGTYGEVFMISKGKKSSVLKIIAVSEDPNIKNLQGLSSVYSEIKVTACLSGLRNNKVNQSKNYVKVERASIVCGSYPSELLAAWDNFSETKSSYNDRPDTYENTQLFAILELQFGGKDMSCFALRNAVEAECILKQIAVSLAVAEEAFLFEHRDLHLGNILVQRNNRKNISYKLRGKDISFECHGLQVTIIDFTLSLLHENGYVYYNDIADDVSLFEQSGDYQFEVYKLMKKHLENKWQECSLYSNILWLKYLCHKMKESKYTRPSTAVHKKGLKAIDTFESKLTDSNCALECLFKWGITNTAFKRDSLNLNRTRNSILVSRNSMQKSRYSVCN